VDGGKGGAFFFFTYDNKLIIKTITDGELLAFRKKLIPYFLHLEENETVISPIYGIYKF
jgi:1-phosphatidylinositol-4-phosphate 5-kinase